MFLINQEDEQYFLQSFSLGEVVLILGAGASFTSTNAAGNPVKQADDLAAEIAKRAGLEYAGEKLPEVLAASKSILSDSVIHRIYENEYKGINPSSELEDIFRYTWKRLYTWCIDDGVDNINISKAQRIRTYNGMSDPAVESEDPLYLQIVKLHGDVHRPDLGFIMSEAEYASALSSERHKWYQKAAQDYLSFVPVFIGSRLAEPILAAELARASRDSGLSSGRAFLITPDHLTAIQKASFQSRRIVHIKSTLKDFTIWLGSKFRHGLSPREVVKKTNNFNNPNIFDIISDDDLQIAHSIYPRDMSKLVTKFAGKAKGDAEREAKLFLRGAPISWELAASNVPVWLSPTTDLYQSLSYALKQRSRLFVVTGQSGSGKTTAIMQCLVRYGQENQDVEIYELRGEVKSVLGAYSLLQRINKNHIVLYIPDLFIFGDTFGSDLLSIPSGKITVISTARSSEWHENLQLIIGDIAVPHDYSRFRRVDYQPLIDKLLDYVPAPAFKKLTPQKRIERISRSRNQLLIALREATESDAFSDIITNEYKNLPDEDSRLLLLIVGLGTIARVGITAAVARDVYNKLCKQRSFDNALSALEGIVVPNNSGRLYARHELYVRHIIDNVVDIKTIIDCLIGILSTFTKYPVPVVRNLNRVDSVLFRFSINHDFIISQCKRRSMLEEGERVYAAFEIDFQLDGHFWLQYGLYLAECGRQDDALTMLRYSIGAYPNNPYAVHAYAELKLKVSLRRAEYDAATSELVADAVKTLLELDAQGQNIDQYPIVTLANLHVAILVKYGDRENAKKVAIKYFDRLQDLEKHTSARRVRLAKERVFRFVALGEWIDNDRRHNNNEPVRHRRKRRS